MNAESFFIDYKNICKCKYHVLCVDDNSFNILILQQLFSKVKIDLLSLYLAMNNLEYKDYRHNYFFESQ